MSDKFEFIDVEYAACRESDEQYVPSIVKMCIWLEVSRSGFYEWRNAPESATAKRRGELALYVKKSFEESDDTYGYRRVHADLAAWGVPAGPELVRSLMRELGLEPCQPRPWRVSLTEGDGQEHDIPDLVQRDFTADAPGEKMVGDITYIPTWEGWLFLAAIVDVFSRRVVGWAMADHLRTELPLEALGMALGMRQPERGLVHHSDRGCQYASELYRAELSARGIVCSMSRVGDCWDNAVAESFFATLKTELIHRRPWPTKAEARSAVHDYIGAFFNPHRRHSSLGYVSPMDFEQQHAAATVAA